MDNRKKLDEEKLASVSGGFTVNQTALNDSAIALLESGQCPCGGKLSAYLGDGFKCDTCATVYQKIRGTTWVSYC